MVRRIYFDNAATTPVDPRVAEAMGPWLKGLCGNPSSLHWAGRDARDAVDKARQQVGALLQAQAGEIIFTASGTEANNMALIGAIAGQGRDKRHMVTSAIEHPSILATCRYLEQNDVKVSYVPVGSDGLIDPDELRKALRPTTSLVSIGAASGVVGTLQPIEALCRITHEHGALFHTDAVQAAGKIPINLQTTPIDLLSLSGHKLYGPKGIGALYLRSGVPLQPLIHGGGQERGLRSATENVGAIVGLGYAAQIAASQMADDAVHLVSLRESIIDSLSAITPSAYLVGNRHRRLPGHISLGLAGHEGEMIKVMLMLDEMGIAVSTGSACSARHESGPSYILQAMGFDALRARGLLRISLGRFNTEFEVEGLLQAWPDIMSHLFH